VNNGQVKLGHRLNWQITSVPFKIQETGKKKNSLLKGTGGTELVRFLKSVRDQTEKCLNDTLNTKEDTERSYYSIFYPYFII